MSSLNGPIRGARYRAARVVFAALAAACANETTGPLNGQSVAVSWMEWPARVSAAAPGTVRVVGTRSGCGTFQLEAVQSGPSSVGVNAVEWRPDPPPPCLALDLIIIFDTVIPLPRLVTPTGPTGSFTIDAPAWSQVGGLSRRAFGIVELDHQAGIEVRAGGGALLLSDSLGCSWLRHQLPGPSDTDPQVLSADVALGPGWRPAFVTGFYATAFSPRCGQTRLFQVTAAEVEITP